MPDGYRLHQAAFHSGRSLCCGAAVRTPGSSTAAGPFRNQGDAHQGRAEGVPDEVGRGRRYRPGQPELVCGQHSSHAAAIVRRAVLPDEGAAAVTVSKGIDLDLGCLYELADGRKGVIQALGNAFGSLDTAPWIALDGDDRTGTVAGGENMSINLGQPGRFKRVLIFAMIYEGAPNWAAVDGVITLTPANGQPIEVRLDDEGVGSRMCAVAQLVDIRRGPDLPARGPLHRGWPAGLGQGVRLGHELGPRPQVDRSH